MQIKPTSYKDKTEKIYRRPEKKQIGNHNTTIQYLASLTSKKQLNRREKRRKKRHKTIEKDGIK